MVGLVESIGNPERSSMIPSVLFKLCPRGADNISRKIFSSEDTELLYNTPIVFEGLANSTVIRKCFIRSWVTTYTDISTTSFTRREPISRNDMPFFYFILFFLWKRLIRLSTTHHLKMALDLAVEEHTRADHIRRWVSVKIH